MKFPARASGPGSRLKAPGPAGGGSAPVVSGSATGTFFRSRPFFSNSFASGLAGGAPSPAASSITQTSTSESPGSGFPSI